MHWICNYDVFDTSGNLLYRGPPKNLKKEEINKKAHKLSVEDFCTWAQSHVPRERNTKTQHINWWTEEKTKQFLKELSFRKVEKAEHMISQIPPVTSTHGNQFDDWKDRSLFSLYMEAVK